MVNFGLILPKPRGPKVVTEVFPIDTLPSKLFQLAGNIYPPSADANNYDSVFLIGFARSGKSTLAQELQTRLGFSVMPLDRLPVSKYPDPELRLSYFRLLLEMHPTGLVIEGDNLIGENRSRSLVEDREALISTVHHLRSLGAKVLFVGNADATVQEKAQAILEFRKNNPCWTSSSRYSHYQVNNLAARSISYSSDLRNISHGLDIDYLEVRPSHFEHDISSGAARILNLLSTVHGPVFAT